MSSKQYKRSPVLKKIPGLLALAAATAFSMAVAVPAQAADPLGGLSRLEVDCVLPSNDGTGVCRGNLVGSATIDDAPKAFAFLAAGTLPPSEDDDACDLVSGTVTLTTHDGSAITMNTDGITCYSNDENTSIRSTGYKITGGTGRFFGAAGAGVLVVSGNQPFTHGLVHISGNIQISQ